MKPYEAFAIAREMDEATFEYRRALATFQACKDRTHAALMELTESIARDGMEAALLTVVAIQHGDADEAYAYARATAQCARVADKTNALLYGTPLCMGNEEID